MACRCETKDIFSYNLLTQRALMKLFISGKSIVIFKNFAGIQYCSKNKVFSSRAQSVILKKKRSSLPLQIRLISPQQLPLLQRAAENMVNNRMRL